MENTYPGFGFTSVYKELSKSLVIHFKIYILIHIHDNFAIYYPFDDIFDSEKKIFHSIFLIKLLNFNLNGQYNLYVFTSWDK